MKRLLFCLSLTCQLAFSQSSNSVNLDMCYRLAQENFPLVKQKGLIQQASALNDKNLRNNYLPQIELNGQATYQSDVTAFNLKIPVPGFEAPQPLSKDQYKLALDVKQIIWDGGVINMQSKVIATGTEVEMQKVEVEIAKLKERVNQLYFSILQVEANVELVNSFKSDLDARTKKLEAAVENGAALKMALQSLQAETIKADQRLIELQATRAAAVQMLSLLINKDLDEKTVFEKPAPQYANVIGLQIQRPELKLYELQKKQIDQSVKVASLKNFPRIFAFGTAGYGRPGLNFLKNEFAFYGIGGLSLKWNLADLYSSTLKNELQIMRNNTQAIDIQKDMFLLNTNITTRQQSAEIVKLQSLIEKDRQIVALREKIKITAAAQLDNGVLTANDYLLELNAENQAKLNLALHELQLLNAQANLMTTKGY